MTLRDSCFSRSCLRTFARASGLHHTNLICQAPNQTTLVTSILHGRPTRCTWKHYSTYNYSRTLHRISHSLMIGLSDVSRNLSLSFFHFLCFKYFPFSYNPLCRISSTYIQIFWYKYWCMYIVVLQFKIQFISCLLVSPLLSLSRPTFP